MKLKILRTVAPDTRYTDADTEQLDVRNKQGSEPIRVNKRAIPTVSPLVSVRSQPVSKDGAAPHCRGLNQPGPGAYASGPAI
jgi:hypothetical protein